MVKSVQRILAACSLACAAGMASVLCAGTRAVPSPPSTTQPASAAGAPVAPLIVTTAPSPVSKAQIETLIGKLSSDPWKERQAAQDQLVQLGPEVRPRLEQLARESQDQEVVARAQGAIRLIAENRLLGPSLVTIHVHNAPAEQVFRELARQAQTEIPAEPPELWSQHEWPRITLNADRVEFWTVFRDACAQARLEPEQGDSQKMRITASAAENLWNQSPAITRGPFLIVALRSETLGSLAFGNMQNIERSATITMQVMVEPKLRLIRDFASASLGEAVDSHGNSLVPAQEGVEPALSTSGDNGRAWDLTLQLQNPGKIFKEPIAHLHGKLHFLAPIRTETLEVEDIMQVRNLSRTIAGRRFIFRSARRNGNGYEVKVTAYRDGLPDADWQQITSPHDFIRLTDDKDRLIPFSNISDSDGGDKQITFSLQFEPINANNGQGAPVVETAGKPSKLIWEIPVETRALQVPFAFDNNVLTLP